VHMRPLWGTLGRLSLLLSVGSQIASRCASMGPATASAFAAGVPAMMTAVVQPVPLGPLEIGQVAVPAVGLRDVLIKVDYAALNRMDLLQVKGLYPLPAGTPDILGVEVAGEVAQVGVNCSLGYEVGTPVMALLLGGGYAEYAVADERSVMKQMSGLSPAQAAALPEAFMTAYQLLFWVGKMKR
jgi:NADPH:quinone reductase-like Zn-dependent oxidoreductase